MNSLALPSRRTGWPVWAERRPAAEALPLQDAQRRLWALLEQLAPRPTPQLPGAVAQGLRSTQAALGPADAAGFDDRFNAGLAAVRLALPQAGCSAADTGRALALASVAMARTLGKTPYPGQMLAAWLLLQGKLVEMATGEGKTLAAALAAAVAALGQVPVHLVTANDYLAQRDRDALAPFYAALGLRVGCVRAPMQHAERAAAYRCDITLVSAKELVFDYLRDHLALGGAPDPGVQRATALAAAQGVGAGHDANAGAGLGASADPAMRLLPGLHMAIIDEADACLLDEAVMPLILARPGAPVAGAALACANAIAGTLQRGRDYRLLQAQRCALLSDSGRALVDAAVHRAAAAADPVTATALAPPQRAHELVQAALAARWLFRREREYTVAAGAPGQPPQVQLIDEVTGRIAHGRQWQGALQQMVQLKEGLAPTPPSEPAALITFQRFFPRCLHLAGMSGTLTEARGELRLLYGLGVVRLPLVLASRRRWLGETLHVDASAKWAAAVAVVVAMQQAGRPVLVGTDSVADSARLSALLQSAGISHQVLNALQDAQEADCIAQAGRAGAVTVATNLAGRGTDIRLDAAAAAAGGLHVLACMRNRARRTDRQLIGRCARHGDPGSAQRLVALDDLLLRHWLPAWLRRAAGAAARGGLVPALWAAPLLALAQRRAEHQERAHRKALRLAERQLAELTGFAGTAE